jgi:hypothetical protein
MSRDYNFKEYMCQYLEEKGYTLYGKYYIPSIIIVFTHDINYWIEINCIYNFDPANTLIISIYVCHNSGFSYKFLSNIKISEEKLCAKAKKDGSFHWCREKIMVFYKVKKFMEAQKYKLDLNKIIDIDNPIDRERNKNIFLVKILPKINGFKILKDQYYEKLCSSEFKFIVLYKIVIDYVVGMEHI